MEGIVIDAWRTSGCCLIGALHPDVMAGKQAVIKRRNMMHDIAQVGNGAAAEEVSSTLGRRDRRRGGEGKPPQAWAMASSFILVAMQNGRNESDSCDESWDKLIDPLCSLRSASTQQEESAPEIGDGVDGLSSNAVICPGILPNTHNTHNTHTQRLSGLSVLP
jgi:hypothetical protein